MPRCFSATSKAFLRLPEHKCHKSVLSRIPREDVNLDLSLFYFHIDTFPMPTNMVIFVEIVEGDQVRTVTEKFKFRDGQIIDIKDYNNIITCESGH